MAESILLNHLCEIRGLINAEIRNDNKEKGKNKLFAERIEDKRNIKFDIPLKYKHAITGLEII